MEETEAEFEHNINEITCDTSFQSPILKKNVSTINDFVYYDLDKQIDTISDSNKQVDPSSNPRVDTNIINRIHKLSVRPILFDTDVIGQDLVTSVQETSINGLLLKSLNSLHTIFLKEIVTDAACNSAQVDRISVQSPSRAIHRTPGVNIDVLIPSRGSNSSFAKWLRNI